MMDFGEVARFLQEDSNGTLRARYREIVAGGLFKMG